MVFPYITVISKQHREASVICKDIDIQLQAVACRPLQLQQKHFEGRGAKKAGHMFRNRTWSPGCIDICTSLQNEDFYSEVLLRNVDRITNAFASQTGYQELYISPQSWCRRGGQRDFMNEEKLSCGRSRHFWAEGDKLGVLSPPMSAGALHITSGERRTSMSCR